MTYCGFAVDIPTLIGPITLKLVSTVCCDGRLDLYLLIIIILLGSIGQMPIV